MTQDRKRRILIAEDEENILAAVSAFLEEFYEVSPVASGNAALALLREQPYDLVLSDVRMPGLDGIELFKAVKKVRPEQKFIFLSVSSLFEEDPEAQDILSVKADGFLSKPYRLPELLVLIERVLADTA